MTSGTFHSIPVTSITVERDRRQRKEVTDVETLAESIGRIGLINPLTVTREHILVAGERRLTAIRALGWTNVSVQYTDELSPHELHEIELEENIKRVDLPWQDQVRALEEYHRLRVARAPSWTRTDTAKALGLALSGVTTQLDVAEKLSDPRVAEAPKYSVARGIVQRDKERRTDASVAEIKKLAGAPASEPKAVRAEPDGIIQADFNRWAPVYEGPRFNFIHCDFPYGINAGDFAQGSAAAHGGYDDSEETYWTLCRTLAENLDRITSSSCHLMFWFSMKFYEPTLRFLSERTDFIVDPFPLIWMKTDNAGILPDPSRGPRRVYETAFFARRGDRKIIKAKANAVGAPTVRERHMSEKPESVLGHFFDMLVDDTSLVLDPTAGSGSAIRAAESRGVKLALGLELNKEYADRANQALRNARALRRASANVAGDQ